MNRRVFIRATGLGAGSLMLSQIPVFGRQVPAEDLLMPGLDVIKKKRLADTALNAATSKGVLMQMSALVVI